MIRGSRRRFSKASFPRSGGPAGFMVREERSQDNESLDEADLNSADEQTYIDSDATVPAAIAFVVTAFAFIDHIESRQPSEIHAKRDGYAADQLSLLGKESSQSEQTQFSRDFPPLQHLAEKRVLNVSSFRPGIEFDSNWHVRFDSPNVW